MSLNYQLTKIENYEELCWVKKGEEHYELNPVTHALIFATMVVDIGEITTKNYEEFYARMTLFGKLNDITYPTIEDVRAHIGLHTNVFPSATRNQWLKRMIGGELDDLISKAHYATTHDVV